MGKRWGVRTGITVLALGVSFVTGSAAWAANPVVALGADLTARQRELMLAQFDIRPTVATRIALISRHQEQILLDGIAPPAMVVHPAVTAVYIVPQRLGYGLRVWTRHTTQVTPAMYVNALATAGMTDTAVRINAPAPVSGVEALAGILWAYQASTGRFISSYQKRTAARELVLTVSLAHATHAPARVVDMLRRVQEEVAQDHLQQATIIRSRVMAAAKDQRLALTPGQVRRVTALAVRMGRLRLSASQLYAQVSGRRHEGLWHRLRGWFSWFWRHLEPRVAAWARSIDERRLHSIDSKHFLVRP